MISTYFAQLKSRSGMSWSDISDASQIPIPTIRKIFSGDTVNPSFDTVVALVNALGGSLSELVEGAPAQSSDAPQPDSVTPPPSYFCKETMQDCYIVSSVVNTYESRIGDIRSDCEHQISSVSDTKDEHITDLKRDKRILAIACAVAVGFVLLMLLIDICIGTRGWIRY